MLTNRRRLTLAGLTVALVAYSLVMVASGPPAGASHIPATGPSPSNCVEFQVNTVGTKSPSAFPDVDIALVSWDNGSESHQVTFSISGLAAGQSVDMSVKSGTNVQEPGPFGNGTHSFTNNLQNAISHIRLCVFGQVTTTTAETTTTVGDTTTTAGDTTTTTGDDTTTTTTVRDTTTTGDPGTTTTVGDTTTTGDPGTTSTIRDEVLGTVITNTTIGAEVVGSTIVAGDLPFTGFDGETLVRLALIVLVLGVLTLLVAKSVRARSNDES
ncbi:MAG TPA: hypothetical protein VNT92_06805 [Acidimicrobiia bacterium]|nr:hypothetical protein [Acidimicrobiia bacterium]